jgi:hypothetical protein
MRTESPSIWVKKGRFSLPHTLPMQLTTLFLSPLHNLFSTVLRFEVLGVVRMTSSISTSSYSSSPLASVVSSMSLGSCVVSSDIFVVVVLTSFTSSSVASSFSAVTATPVVNSIRSPLESMRPSVSVPFAAFCAKRLSSLLVLFSAFSFSDPPRPRQLSPPKSVSTQKRKH